ncbi:hypothetical protein A0H81_02762 [Grifola frondosa]|uniref:F-box domain-containing protein n=1 Tax=Grifola frondosa TaxID=5627 RepID=A0A1C7MLX2_GRIFR|nr:hypothetical protein A0H81_02762 [Grifola frondosa]
MRLHPHFRDLLSALNHDILFQIMDELNLSDLVALRRMSSRSDELVSAYLDHKFHKLLATFFADVPTARGLMRNTNAVISGSSALAYVLPANISWSPSDLDLYVPNVEFNHVVAYLEVFEDYTDVTQHGLHNHYSAAVLQVTRLEKGGRTIDVIKSASNSALLPLPFFWMTAVINYLSADYAYVGHPELTFQNYALLHPLHVTHFQTPIPRTIPLVQKYTERAFDIRTRNVEWSHLPAAPRHITRDRLGGCSSTVRFFGDEFGLAVSMHPASAVVHDVVVRQQLTIIWRRGGLPCGLGCLARLSDSTAFVEEAWLA